MDLNKAALARLVTAYPSALRAKASLLRPRLQWYRDELGLTAAQLATVITREPRLLALNPETALAPKARWLREELSISQENLVAMVMKVKGVVHLCVFHLRRL